MDIPLPGISIVEPHFLARLKFYVISAVSWRFLWKLKFYVPSLLAVDNKGHSYLTVNFHWGTLELANFNSHSFVDCSFDLEYLSPGCLKLLNFPLSFCCSLLPFLANLILFHFGQKPLESCLLSGPLCSIPSTICPVLLFITPELYTSFPSCELREFYICFAILTSFFPKFSNHEYKGICYTWRFNSHFVSPLSIEGSLLILCR